MERLFKVQMEADLRNQSLARSVAAAYASEFDPTVDELTDMIFRREITDGKTIAAVMAYKALKSK